MKLSIVIPAYNIEQCISLCLDSIFRTNSNCFGDFEVIVVDDGSIDNTPAILDEYKTRYDNLNVIHQENLGVSIARNTALEYAKGEYVTFVDGDDLIAESSISEVLSAISEFPSVDVFYFNSIEYFSNGTCISHCNKAYDSEKCISSLQLQKDWYIGLGSVCGLVIKSKIIVNNNLRFAEGVRNMEDTIFMYELLSHEYVGMFLDKKLNIISYRPGSASRDISVERIVFFKNNIDYLRSLLYSPYYNTKDKKGYIHQAIYATISAATNLMISTSNTKLDIKKSLCFDDLLPLELRYMDPRFSLKIMLVNHCFPIYIFLCWLKYKIRSITF